MDSFLLTLSHSSLFNNQLACQMASISNSLILLFSHEMKEWYGQLSNSEYVALEGLEQRPTSSGMKSV